VAQNGWQQTKIAFPGQIDAGSDEDWATTMRRFAAQG
jgi:hypothetical protein